MVAGCQLIVMKFCERIKIACSGLCLPITHVYVVTFYIVCFKVLHVERHMDMLYMYRMLNAV